VIAVETYISPIRKIHHHHRMALQPKSDPGLPFWGFVTVIFLRGWIVSPAPNPQPGGPGLRIYDPRRQGGPAIPQALGTHFSRLLRHSWVTVGLLFNPGHHTGYQKDYLGVLLFPHLLTIMLIICFIKLLSCWLWPCHGSGR
jgi:hypothetical protein